MSTVTTWEKAGFFNEKINIDLALQKLDNDIEQMPVLIESYSAEELLHHPAPGKWSKQEIVGHLIDSAMNNLKRFTEIQFLPQPYKVIPYRQNELVNINHYQDLPIAHLLDLWRNLNQQISYVVKNTAPEKFEYSLHTYDTDEMKSLGWLICDYVAHLEHHLRQITGEQ